MKSKTVIWIVVTVGVLAVGALVFFAFKGKSSGTSGTSGTGSSGTSGRSGTGSSGTSGTGSSGTSGTGSSGTGSSNEVPAGVKTLLAQYQMAVETAQKYQAAKGGQNMAKTFAAQAEKFKQKIESAGYSVQ